jgi:hypothetical protein
MAIELLAKKQRLLQQLEIAHALQQLAVQNAEYEEAQRNKLKAEKIQQEIDEWDNTQIQLKDLEVFMRLVRVLVSRMPAGQLVKLMAKSQFKSLRPLIEDLRRKEIKFV